MSFDKTCIVHYSHLHVTSIVDFTKTTWKNVHECRYLYENAACQDEMDVKKNTVKNT